MALITISKPTQQQVVHSIERILLVFITVGGGYWLKSSQPFSKAAATGAVFAGATAVYQAVLAIFTTL